ncbi:hypothetical protein Salat_0240900 [Sesamum alatum]|uniref:Reverse transcriptase zinc-binding domain-containing protein n=1 Tax=Sesamum alatum TaxID=300844 RepID=A0AAE1YZF4_9LAMI|nr:hypothetical protein Salat_0240900 [Sesamum alatum]
MWILLDVTQPLKRALRVRLHHDASVVVHFTYERLPNFCYLCARLGPIQWLCVLQFTGGFIDPGVHAPYGPWLREKSFGSRSSFDSSSLRPTVVRAFCGLSLPVLSSSDNSGSSQWGPDQSAASGPTLVPSPSAAAGLVSTPGPSVEIGPISGFGPFSAVSPTNPSVGPASKIAALMNPVSFHLSSWFCVSADNVPGALNLVDVPFKEAHVTEVSVSAIPPSSTSSSGRNIDMQAISAIPAPQSTVPNRLVWHFSNSGSFTVRSAYNVSVALEFRESEASQSGLGEVPLGGWDYIWKQKIPDKMVVIGIWILWPPYFCDADMQAISAIPAPQSTVPDRLVWHFSNSGSFTVRSAYNVSVALEFRESEASQSGLGEAPLGGWDYIWKQKIPGKVKLFAWRLYKQTLPTAYNLKRKRVLPQAPCPQCSHEEEDS